MIHFSKLVDNYTEAHKAELARAPHLFGTSETEYFMKQKMLKEYPTRLGVYEAGDAYDLNLVSRNDEEYKQKDSGELYKDLKEKMAVGLCLKCEKRNDRRDQDECICTECRNKAFGK